MTTVVNGNTGTVFSDLRRGAHTYQPPELPDKLDKESIAGIPFVITDYSTYPSKFDADREFVVLQVMLADDTEGSIVDSGAAIIPQLAGQALPLYVPGGLVLGRNGKTWRLDFTDPATQGGDIPF